MSRLSELLRDPELVRGAQRLIRRHPIAAVAAGALLGAAAFAVLKRPAPAPIAVAVWPKAGGGGGSRIPWIPPSPAAVRARERAVRVWAYRLEQGEAELAEVPPELAYDVERYRLAGGREPAGSADGAIPFDW